MPFAVMLSLGLAIQAAIVRVRVPVRRRPHGLAAVCGVVAVTCFPLAAFAGGGGPQSTRRWLVANSLGSNVLVLSNVGDRFAAKIFRPFGEEEAVAGVGTTEYGTRYAGHKKEENSDLYYMNARWMDAKAGRFVSVDPLSATGRPFSTSRRASSLNSRA